MLLFKPRQVNRGHSGLQIISLHSFLSLEKYQYCFWVVFWVVLLFPLLTPVLVLDECMHVPLVIVLSMVNM